MHGSVGPPGFLLGGHSDSLEVSHDQQTGAPLLRISVEIGNVRGMACCIQDVYVWHMGILAYEALSLTIFLTASSLASMASGVRVPWLD